jgi:hypothetical protein
VHPYNVHQVLCKLLTGFTGGIDRATDKELHDQRTAAPNDRGKNVNET